MNKNVQQKILQKVLWKKGCAWNSHFRFCHSYALYRHRNPFWLRYMNDTILMSMRRLFACTDTSTPYMWEKTSLWFPICTTHASCNLSRKVFKLLFPVQIFFREEHRKWRQTQRHEFVVWCWRDEMMMKCHIIFLDNALQRMHFKGLGFSRKRNFSSESNSTLFFLHDNNRVNKERMQVRCL